MTLSDKTSNPSIFVMHAGRKTSEGMFIIDSRHFGKYIFELEKDVNVRHWSAAVIDFYFILNVSR